MRILAAEIERERNQEAREIFQLNRGPQIVVASGILFRVFPKKYKLHNLISF